MRPDYGERNTALPGGRILLDTGGMSELAKKCTSSVIPGMRYRKAPEAIEWLCAALGFEKNAVHANPDGTIAHAQLTFGNGMIMLGSVVESDYGKLMKQPDEIGMANTQSTNLISADPGRDLRSGASGGSPNYHRHCGHGLRWPRLHLPGSGRPPLECWQLRPLADRLRGVLAVTGPVQITESQNLKIILNIPFSKCFNHLGGPSAGGSV